MKKLRTMVGKVLCFAMIVAISVACASEKNEKQAEKPKVPEVVYEDLFRSGV